MIFRNNEKYQMLVVGLLAFALFMSQALQWQDWIIDDAGISYAYARNLAEGHGLVAQPGQMPVEGYSNLLWILLLSPFFAWHLFHPFLTPKLIGYVFVLISFLVIGKGIRKTSAHGIWVSLFALCLLSLNPSFVMWTCSGLENSLYIFLLVLGFYLMLRANTGARSGVWIGIVIALAAMTRPDGLIFSLVYPAFVLFQILTGGTNRRAGLRQCLWYMLGFGMAYGLFLGFRLLYFHAWAPNTYFAKIGPFSQSGLGQLATDPKGVARKLFYVFRDAAGFGGYLLLPLIGIGSIRLMGRNKFGAEYAAALFFLAMALGAYLYLPDDWMGEYRLATPFIVFLYLYGVLVLDTWIGCLMISSRAKTCLILILGLFWVGGALASFIPRHTRCRTNPPVSFAKIAADYGGRYDAYAASLGIEQASVLLPDMGATLYYSKVKLYDLAGLCDAMIARTLGRDQRAFYDYVFKTIQPTFIHVHGCWTGMAALDGDTRFRRDYVPIHEYRESSVYFGQMRSGDFVRKDVVREEALIRLQTECDKRAAELLRDECFRVSE